MDALLSLFDVSLSLSLFLAPQILSLDKERKKERKEDLISLFLLLGLLLLVPSKASHYR